MEWQPFILYVEGEQLVHHQHWAGTGENFLCKWLGMVEVMGLQWLRDFVDVVETTKFYDETE